MAPLSLSGDNLGERHRSFNALVNEAIANKLPYEPTLVDNDDLNNLFKIDLASKIRDVDFILEVYKCEDMLYVSRALKRTTWLITDNKYAHIIQPNYLYNELFPQMTTKAVNKLLLNVRLHLKDEVRVQEFYDYIKLKDQREAFKWLPKCSIPFIENEVQTDKSRDIRNHILVRLFERSLTVFEAYIKKNQYYEKHSHYVASHSTEKYMDLLETKFTCYLDLSRRIKKRLMKMFPERIFNKIEHYYYSIDIALRAKYVRERPELREIMINKAKDNKGTDFFGQNNIRHWITLLPKENRFDIVKKNIIMKEDVVNDDGLINLCAKGIQNPDTVYEMYKYAPFDIAFEDLKKLIRSESAPTTRNSILIVLLTAAGDNMKDLKTLLEYYYEKHVNTPYKFKIEIINAFIQTNTHAFDNETWEILNKLFQSAEVYMNSENNLKYCIDAIIVRNVIRGKEIPPIIKSKFVFSTLKEYETKLKNASEKNAVFEFLYNCINEEINVDNIATEADFCKCLSSLNKLANVLKDWNKNLNDFPEVVRQIKMLIEINKKNSYGMNLSTFYFANKEWRRTMFEESITLAPSDKVLVNAIKHDAKMLYRHKEEIIDVLSNDNIPLKQMLRKIRVYWTDTIAEEFKTLYKNQIENKGNKTAVSGFCTLVSHKELQALIEQYVPSEAKIDWNKTDERVYNVRKNIARTVYQARPIIPIDFILLYAKGDYLQYTVPSLCAVLSQLSPIMSGQCISKLLNAPVSLQKYGIRFPFMKLNAQHLVPLASEIWNSTKNSSIRTVLVSSLHTRLCQEIDESQAIDIWRLLSKFIDDLTCDENNIFDILPKVKNIPQIVRQDYIMKVYRILDSLPPKVRRFPQKERIRNKYIIEVMHLLDDDFVIDCLLKDTSKTITSNQNLPHTDIHLLASFILCNKDEDTQERRYNFFLAPLLDSCITNWTHSGKTNVRVQTRLLLKHLPQQFREMTVKKRMNMPYKVFLDIQSKLEGGLSYDQNYIFLTYWKVVVEVIRVLNEFKEDIYKFDDEYESNINVELKNNLASLFGKFCVKTLKEDLKKFDPSVYQLFTRALTDFLDDHRYVFDRDYLNSFEIFKHILENSDEADIEIYMAVIILLAHELKWAHYCRLDLKHYRQYVKETQEILQSHSSLTLKIHYDNLFSTDENCYFLNNY